MGFLVELWDNQPATVIGSGIAIAVLLGIYIFLLNTYNYFLLVKEGDTIFKVLQGTAYYSPESI